ncbi:MAG: cbb3-type cytochrome c oxidase subunit 3 [Alphaproteobacteria bacterium]|nr:cbb3-type cytochrome c oxidase subunit 3 [Alphaproteobacteria bacterium]
MDFDYQTLRTAADSWGLLYLFIMFILACAFAFRPGSKARYKDAAQIPLKED